MKTYSEIHGEKRESEKLTPRIVYDESMEFLTDKQVELLLVQHKLMREFLSKKKLIDDYNAFQERKRHLHTGVYAEWRKKWE